MSSPEFEAIIQSIVKNTDGEQLSQLRQEFHKQLNLVMTQPDNPELVSEIWDFFYDWCVYEKHLVDTLNIKPNTTRSLFEITKISTSVIKLYDLYTKKTFLISPEAANDFIGMSKGDYLEARLVTKESGSKAKFTFLRKSSYHSHNTHKYLKKKMKHFRKNQNYLDYQDWLWAVVGMYLKHRLYTQLPVEKIYDDQSPI